jgi:hypothetical protein
MVAPDDQAFLFYGGPDGDIVLTQIPVGEQPGSEGGYSTFRAIGMPDTPRRLLFGWSLPDGAFRAIGMLPGTHIVIWEANGIGYTLGGANLDEVNRMPDR